MKALIVITGRGLGGDASNALNLIKTLEKRDIKCEIALDSSAPGILFKKNGYSWHKIKIPQAGGHAVTKKNTIKAALKMITAVFKIRSLIKKIKPDIVVGVIGGGAVVGCVGAKITNVPAVGIIDTPLDTAVCSRLNRCIILPEHQMFKNETLPPNLERAFFLMNNDFSKGDKNKALKLIKESAEKNNYIFDENKKTILFSSGSSLFELMAKAVSDFAEENDDYNIVLIGIPLKEEYNKLLDNKKIINLKYINWVKDLYEYVDLAVLTDDGLMIQEAVAFELPSVALTRVKYGRYHNMEGIYKGAILESEFDELNEKIQEALDNLDKLSEKSKKYSKEIFKTNDKVADIIIEEYEKNKK
ncbi:MAG: glycosyltransferase [Methanobacteriaceae archaeon]|jgi:UDP-N-acetylglucosamine--N-acetylmuramyl-(pentapeptide) pyrophosphoryl-undecaprenol N-acetylglucosamine transferase|nr:glycosyltransferase [Methanobacteriaceae archaeon]